MERTKYTDKDCMNRDSFWFRKRRYLDQVRETCGGLLLLYAITRWKVSRTNAEKNLEMMSKVSEWAKQNRKKFHYKHSTYFILKNGDPPIETWMNIDEYKDQEAYEEFTKIRARDRSLDNDRLVSLYAVGAG